MTTCVTLSVQQFFTVFILLFRVICSFAMLITDKWMNEWTNEWTNHGYSFLVQKYICTNRTQKKAESRTPPKMSFHSSLRSQGLVLGPSYFHCTRPQQHTLHLLTMFVSSNTRYVCCHLNCSMSIAIHKILRSWLHLNVRMHWNSSSHSFSSLVNNYQSIILHTSLLQPPTLRYVFSCFFRIRLLSRSGTERHAARSQESYKYAACASKVSSMFTFI